MATPRLYTDPESSEAKADLHGVLNAWHHATVRLEQTHEMLPQEVAASTKSSNQKTANWPASNILPNWVRPPRRPFTIYAAVPNQSPCISACSAKAFSRFILQRIDRKAIPRCRRSLDVTVNDLVEFTNDRVPLAPRRRIAPALGRNAPILGAAVCRSSHSCRTRCSLGPSALRRTRNAPPLYR